MNSSAPVWAEETDWGSSNVDYQIPSDSKWRTLTGTFYKTTTAITELIDTNNKIVDSNVASSNSTGTIRYSNIFVRPSVYGSLTNNNATLEIFAHELGHVIGLGHVDQNKNSLMRRLADGTITKPTTYDINCLNSMY